MLTRALLIAVIMTASANAQTAEDYHKRQSNLAELASVFGELHHIRRICEPRFEGDVWRERMKTLVSLEQPQAEARERMVKRFNAGFRNASGHFQRCSRPARDHAARRAVYARSLVAQLSAPLREAEQDETAMAGPLLLKVTPVEE